MGYEDLSSRGEKTFALGGTRKDKKTGKRFYNPVQVEGYFLGARKVDNPKSRKGFDWIYQLQGTVTDRTGKPIFTGKADIYGKTFMDTQMASAKIGVMTLIKFTGMQDPADVKNGNQPGYLFKCAQDKSNAIEGVDAPAENDSDTGAEDASVADAPAEEAGDAGDLPPSEEFEEEAGLDAEEAAVDEPPAKPAQKPKTVQTPAADRQAQMQKLIGGGKAAKTA